MTLPIASLMPALAVSSLLAVSNTSHGQPDAAPRTFCRFVPERSDDFAWENDKVAFRAYGPALRKGNENGGFDCWLKRVEYPIIDKWYKEDKQGKPYHTDRGEGYDPYHVGSTLGCGGIAPWVDGKLVNTETFTSWKVAKCEQEESIFELNHEWEHEGHAYKQTKQIRIRKGDRLFHVLATTSVDGKPASGLPMAVGLTTHDGKAKASGDARRGWASCWEKIDGSGLGTGVLMDPSKVSGYKELKSDKPDQSHALLLTKANEKGQVSWWAGYGWEKAGGIRNVDEWLRYLEDFPRKD